MVTVRPPAGLSRRASTARLSAGFKQKGEPSFRKVPLFASILFLYEILLPGATSPPGTIKTIGFRLPTCRASNFPRTAGRNSTHRPQVRHDGSLPRTVEGKPKLRIAGSVINGLPRAVKGETLHSLMAGPSPMKSPCAISTQGLWKGRLYPKTGRGRGTP